MYGVVEFSIVPLGTGKTSVSEYVKIAYNLLKNKGFILETHSMGTNIEGDIEKILNVILEVNREFRKLGVKRIVTTIKIDYRIDKNSIIDNKNKAFKE